MIAEPPPIDRSDSGTKTSTSAMSVSSRIAQTRRQARATLRGAITSTTGISGQRRSPTQAAVTAMTTRPGGNRSRPLHPAQADDQQQADRGEGDPL